MVLMILARRKAHFWAIVALACTLPWVFLAGLLGRPSVPSMGDSADDLFAAANFSTPTTVAKTLGKETLQVNSISVQVEVSRSSSGQIWLELQPALPLRFSDVLVYWAADALPDERKAQVPDAAVLLGQLSGTSRRQFVLSQPIQEQIQQEPGYLLFYSRGQQQTIGTTPLPKTLISKD